MYLFVFVHINQLSYHNQGVMINVKSTTICKIFSSALLYARISEPFYYQIVYKVSFLHIQFNDFEDT